MAYSVAVVLAQTREQNEILDVVFIHDCKYYYNFFRVAITVCSYLHLEIILIRQDNAQNVCRNYVEYLYYFFL